MREVIVRPRRRRAAAALRGVVHAVWVSAEMGAEARREHVLPSGCMHLAVRLGSPMGLVEGDAIRWVGAAVVGGARETFYVKESVPCISVGAQLGPFASLALFGVPADELAARHTPLEALWGADARALVDRLHAALRRDDPTTALLDVFERALIARLRPSLESASREAVRAVLGAFDPRVAVADHVARSGLSHRAFVEHFRSAVGLAPKAYASVLRFQSTLDALAGGREPHVEIALAAGYADQAHYAREIARRAGVSPSRYRASYAGEKNHLLMIA